MNVVKVETSPEGEYYLTLDSTPLSSRYSPAKEASRLLAPLLENKLKDKQGLVILLGAGHPALIKKCQNELKYAALLIIDEHPEVLEILQSPPLSFRWSHLTTLVAGQEWKQELKFFFNHLKAKNIRILINRSQWKLNPEFYEAVRREAIDLYDRKSINIATISRFERLWLKNITQNTEAIIAAPGVRQLKDGFLNLPALILGAGPSLAPQLEIIRTYQDRVVLIAVDTVYKVLIRHGIYPHFVVIVDPQKINSKYVEGIDQQHLRKSYFVAEPAVCPRSIRDKTNRLFVFNTIFPYFKFICHYFGDKGNVDMGGSVATTAFDLATQLGFSQVALAGLDLSYSDDAYHLPGTLYEEIWFSMVNRLKNFEMLSYNLLNYGSLTLSQNTKNKKIYLDAKFTMFIRWFENKVVDNPFLKKIFINCTEGGHLLKGIDNKPLAFFLKKYGKSGQALSEKFAFVDRHFHRKKLSEQEQVSSFLSHLNSILNNLKKYRQNARQAIAVSKKNHSELAYQETSTAIDQELFKNFDGKEFINIALQKIIHQITTANYQSWEEARDDAKHLYESIDEVCGLNIEYIEDVIRRMSRRSLD